MKPESDLGILLGTDDKLSPELQRIADNLKQQAERPKGSAKGPRPTPPPVSERKRIRRDARDARKLNRA